MVWYGVAWHDMEWYGMVWYGMVWYGMVWYGTVWYGMVRYGMDDMARDGMVWYGMVWVWYGTVRYGMVWFYSSVNPMGSCRAWSVYLTTLLLGRLSPLKQLTSNKHILSPETTTALLESAEGRE